MPYKLNPLAPLNLCYYEDVETIGDTRYLLLDQITPQTIINGMPIFDAGIQVGHQGEDYTCYFELTQTDALGGGSIPYLKGFSSQATNNIIALDSWVEIVGGDGTTLSPAKLFFVDVDNNKSIALYYDSANGALRTTDGSNFDLSGGTFYLHLGYNIGINCDDYLIHLFGRNQLKVGDFGILDFSALSEDRTFTFPDATGTIALIEDIPELVWGNIGGTLSDQTDLQDVLDSKLENIVEDTTPELGGELSAGAHSVGFTQQSATGDGTTTIDWKLGNKFFFTFGAQNEVFTFTAPSEVCNLSLVLKQDATGNRTATFPATVKWAGGIAPTLSTGANAVDIISFYYNGTNFYGVANFNFS